LSACRRQADRRCALEAAIERAVLDGLRGFPGAAQDALSALAPEANALGDEVLSARLWNAIGNQAGAVGDAEAAVAAFAGAARAARRAGAHELEAGAWNNTAAAWMRARRPQEAEQAWARALEAFRSLGDRTGAALALGNLAAAASAQGRMERSR